MGHLVEYLRTVIQRSPIIKDHLESKEHPEEEKYHTVGHKLSRIFSITKKELPLSAEADEVLNQAAAKLEEKLNGFKPSATEQDLAQVDHIIEDLLKILIEEEGWQELLAEINNDENRHAFKQDVEIAFIFKVIGLCVNRGVNQHNLQERTTLSKYLNTAAESRGQPMQERLKKLEKQLPALVCPTLCYFEGHSGTLQHFGHVAVGVFIHHDIILNAQPPPPKTAPETSKTDYLNSLPLDPANSAYLVAGHGFNLILYTADNSEDANLEIETLKNQVKSNKINDHYSPILIKKGESYFIFAGTSSLNLNGWKLTELTNLSVEEKDYCDQLTFSQSEIYPVKNILDGDPLLTPLVDLVKKHHKEVSNIYYIDRSKKEVSITQIAWDDEPASEFKNRYILETPIPMKESSGLVKHLSPEETVEIAQTYHMPANMFSPYLTYGLSATPQTAGISDPSTIMEDIESYGKCHFINLPPRSQDRIQRATTQFSEMNRNKYNVLWKNCAHAVADFMHSCGYLSAKKLGLDPTPKGCANQAIRVAMQELGTQRKIISQASYLTPQKKITSLLELDLAHLELQLKWDQINKKPSEKNQRKIQLVSTLLSTFRSTEKLEATHLDALIKTIITLGGQSTKTGKNIIDYLDYFPSDALPKEAVEKKTNFLIHLKKEIENYLLINKPSKLKAENRALFALKKLLDSNTQEKNSLPSFSAAQSYFLFEKVLALLSKEAAVATSKYGKQFLEWEKQALTIANLNQAEGEIEIEEKITEVSINAIPSFPNSRPEMPPAPFSPSSSIDPDPDQWYSLQDNPHSQYQFLKEEPVDAKQLLRTALSTSATKTVTPLPDLPLIRSGLRLSTHQLPSTSKSQTPKDSDLCFGLLEKCIKPGYTIHSQALIPAEVPLSTEQWLQIIDKQILESEKLMGKKSSALTIHSLEWRELQPPKRELEPFETAYIQYCLTFNIRCRIMHEGKETTLTPDFLRSLIQNFDSTAVKKQIDEARSLLSTDLSENASSHFSPS